MSAEPAPRILIIRRRYLGDIVLLGSLLRNLRLHWPGSHLAVLLEERFADVIRLNPDANEAVALPRRWFEWPAFLRRIRASRFTHVLDLDNTEKTAVTALLSGATMRVGLHHGDQRVKLPRAYSHLVHDPSAQHESRPITDYYLRALEPLGVPQSSREVRLEPAAEEVAAIRRFVGANPRVLLVHPGSRSPMRIWPALHFAEVIDYAQDELDAQVVLVGGPTDQPVVDEIRAKVRTHLMTLPGALPIGRFAALARVSTAMLCHDSGPMHVAAAVGTPVIAIYGSQNATLFRPVGEAHTLLQPPLPCVTCVAPDRCVPEDSYRNLCVRNVTVETVRAAVRAKLAGRR
jgi:ADP-heptose:LPS heptosyltransferase